MPCKVYGKGLNIGIGKRNTLLVGASRAFSTMGDMLKRGILYNYKMLCYYKMITKRSRLMVRRINE